MGTVQAISPYVVNSGSAQDDTRPRRRLERLLMPVQDHRDRSLPQGQLGLLRLFAFRLVEKGVGLFHIGARPVVKHLGPKAKSIESE